MSKTKSLRPVYYLAHPVRGDTAQDVKANLANAKTWLRWLFFNRPHIAYIAPWIAEVEAMQEVDKDVDPAVMAKALDDDCSVITRCDGIILVGGRVSTGMAIERACALGAQGKNPFLDILDWSQYRTPRDLPEDPAPFNDEMIAEGS